MARPEHAHHDDETPDGTTFAVRQYRRDTAEVLVVSGELDFVTAPLLREEIAGRLDGSPVTLVLDLSAVSFLASTGLSLLLEAQEMAKPAGTVRIVATQRAVLRPIEATALDQVLSLFPTVDDALA